MAIMTGFLAMYVLILIVWYLILVIASWKIFTKAGEGGWKAIIPVYNTYITFKISWNVRMFWIMLIGLIAGTFMGCADQPAIAAIGHVITFACGIINLTDLYMLARSFGHGIGYTLGLIFLNPIFTLILGFGVSEYEGPQG